jgi:hypothetical protein
MMMSRSFFQAGFLSNRKNPFGPLAVTRTEVPVQRVILKLPLDEFIFPDSHKTLRKAEGLARRRTSIPGYTEFAFSLKV